jgi:glycosyltransferase involved in cell wall biosynthesis
MAAGLPVIASDFPLWRKIVTESGCGLLVDPRNPQAIAEAMNYILSHPDEAAAMGQRGRTAVEGRYNWETEFPKLQRLYGELNKERRP